MNSKYKILVVDDDPDLLEVVVGMTQRAGFQVLAAHDGATAVKLLESNTVHTLISDIRMPNMSGLELFAQTRAQNIPAIFVSGFTDTVDLNKALEMGASDFLSKPFTSEELLNSIELALRGTTTDSNSENKPQTQYCRVPIDTFLAGPTIQHDVFIRLSELRFLRIARADSPLSRQRIDSYRQKGLAYLFVLREDFAKYVDFNLNLARVASAGRVSVSHEHKAQLLKYTSEAYLENIYMNGIDRNVFEEGRALVETTLRLISESDDIFAVLDLLRRRGEDDYTQSLAVAVYSSLIARELGWTSPQTLFRVAVAGLLHDVGTNGLSRDAIKKYRIDRISLTDIEIRNYQAHPTIGRDLLAKIGCVPEEVLIAVSQHHENMAGLGYPNRPSRMKFHPLSRILNLADAFCAKFHFTPNHARDLNAKDALLSLVASRESEFDPQMLRALFQVLKVPVPDRIANTRTYG